METVRDSWGLFPFSYPSRKTECEQQSLHWVSLCLSTANSHAFCFMPFLYYLNVLAWRMNEIINTEHRVWVTGGAQ